MRKNAIALAYKTQLYLSLRLEGEETLKPRAEKFDIVSNDHGCTPM